MAKYLTSGALGAICGVTSRTIRNWKAGGKGPPGSITTPGGHLQFVPRDLVPWLRAKGYDVPADLAEQANAGATS